MSRIFLTDRAGDISHRHDLQLAPETFTCIGLFLMAIKRQHAAQEQMKNKIDIPKLYKRISCKSFLLHCKKILTVKL